MVLSFKSQFVDKILSGEKIHTIREDKADRWHKGRIIHFDTNVRTPNQKRFKWAVCTGVQEIFMTYANNDIIEITIDDSYLYYPERKKLAINDGFDDWQDFFNWFYPVIKESPEECFSGKIIHWTDMRY